jgi:hypothetical protein
MRNKYPQLTLGAISISAPLEVVMNFQGECEIITGKFVFVFLDYKEAVNNALWRISEPCAARLRDGFDLLNAELQVKNKWEKIADELNLK